MRRFAIINQKGGVGKTTTTANLGAALAKAGLRVLLVDLDPQGHLTLHFGADVADDEPSVYDMLTAATPAEKVALSVRDGITLLPADIDLAGAEAELVSVTGREVLLREALESVEQDYDVLLIDCPPSLGVLTINALAAAREVLIPLQAHFFGLQGIGKLLQTIVLVQQRINPSLRVHGIALCMHESATRLANEVTEDLIKFLESARDADAAWSNARVYKTSIRRNIKLAEASSFGQTVFDYAPRSNGATDYARLAAEVFGDMAPALRTQRSPGSAAEPRATEEGNNQGVPPVAAECPAASEADDTDAVVVEQVAAPKETVVAGPTSVGEVAVDEGVVAKKAVETGDSGCTPVGECASPKNTVAAKPAPRRSGGSGGRRTAEKCPPEAHHRTPDSQPEPAEQADSQREKAAATT